ncbi:MAG: hypothetical protein MPJ50_18970 [Pirellulales bacterium]|nr:hypothetical protein [Pirellulales bacterium]
MNDTPLVSRRTQRVLWMGLSLGVIMLVIGFLTEPTRAWSSLFVNAYFFMTAGLAGAAFLALAAVSGARWHLPFRRIAELLIATVPLAACVMLGVIAWRFAQLIGDHTETAHPLSFWFKEAWLEPKFWLIRTSVCLAIWTLLSIVMLRQGRRSQPHTITGSETAFAAMALIVFAITLTVASVDWTMALEPEWFSTMWGVYQFSGMFQAGLAVMILLAISSAERNAQFRSAFQVDHLHDLGKLLIGFSCFWMYIWFCQYMLIWYSNIPEETSYFMVRTRGDWGPIVIASIIMNWVIPFFILLPRTAKRSVTVMKRVAAVVLIGRWLDIYVMVYPSTQGATPNFAWMEIAGMLCLIGGTPLAINAGYSRLAVRQHEASGSQVQLHLNV